MGFILLIVFILTIFKAWKQSSLYRRFANRPYDTRKHTHTMPVMLFLCIYMYLHICERPDNTRVGANCN